MKWTFNEDLDRSIIERVDKIIRDYRAENNGDMPTHIIVSPRTKHDIMDEATPYQCGLTYENRNFNEPEEYRGCVIAIVQVTGNYLEVV